MRDNYKLVLWGGVRVIIMGANRREKVSSISPYSSGTPAKTDGYRDLPRMPADRLVTGTCRECQLIVWWQGFAEKAS